MTSSPSIATIGVHIPSTRVSNLDRLSDFMITQSFLTDKLGVEWRAIKDAQDETSDLCVKAFYALQEKTNLDPAEVELLCVVTQNPDQRIPHTAAVVHQKLKIGKHCMTFDVSQGCAGYTHGLAIVSSLMASLGLGHAILLTCDPYSKIVRSDDKNTALLFGDAATATYMSSKGGGYSLVDTHFGTLPQSNSCLSCRESLHMNGRDVLNNALREVPNSIQSLLRANSLSSAEVDLFVFHQASKLMVELLRQDLGLDESRAPFDIAKIGNTISSSIPIMLEPYVEEREKQLIVLSGFGAGFSFASSLIKLID